MKQERDVLVIGSSCRAMRSASPAAVVASVSPSPKASAATCLTRQPFPTPSHCSFPFTSTGWSTRPSIHFLIFFLSFWHFFCFCSLAVTRWLWLKEESQSTTNTAFALHAISTVYVSLPWYCFLVNILAFAYSSFQLFKGICDISRRAILISDLISDYISFIPDQLVCYLLISSSSVAIPVIQHSVHLEGSHQSPLPRPF